jgi:type I protein arginine methyltransferase
MYRIADYGDMIADEGRSQAYAEALRRHVRPGSVVADLGCGTGFFSLLACKLGARRVYAVESAPVAEVAREAARINGLGDRIVVLQGDAGRIELPERVDILLSDLRGILPLFGKNLVTLRRARESWLAPAGVMIPNCDRLHVAVVGLPARWTRLNAPWQDQRWGLDLTCCQRYATNAWYRVHAESTDLLTEPLEWAILNYAEFESPHLRGTARLTCRRGGPAHGFLLWFDSTLAPDTGFSTAPGLGRPIYGQGFFPWPQEQLLNENDQVSVDLRADLVGEDYVWTWTSTIHARTSEAGSKKQFRQSTFQGQPISAELLNRASGPEA